MRRARQRSILRQQRRARRVAGAAGAAVLLSPAAAGAATFTVTSTADTGPGSLRAAVVNANANAGDDTIDFSLGAGASTIRLTSAELTVTNFDPGGADTPQNLTIQGPGRDLLTISGDANGNGTSEAGDVRVLNVQADNGSTLDVSGVTLTRGWSSTSGSDHGGALRADSADVNLTDAAVTNSRTESTDGGGGLFVGGDLRLTRTLVTGNTAADGGGGGMLASGDAVVDRATVSGNTAKDGGGGIREQQQGTLTVLDSTIAGNNAPDGPGGGVLSAFAGMRIERSTLTGNTAQSGGAVFGYTAKYGSGVFNSTVTGNSAQGGGGIALFPIKYAATVSESVVSGNQATAGGGVVLGAAGPATSSVERSLIEGNTVSGTGAVGGGVLFSEVGGESQLVDTTVTGNSAPNGGGVGIGTGSPVFKYSDGKVRGAIDLDNSTISGNAGGGVFLSSYDFGTPTTRRAATAGLTSTIVSGNNGPDTDRTDDATSGGLAAAFSLVGNPGDGLASSNAVITGQDPQLGPLADNGGPTKTMLPAGGSPVLDQGRSTAKVNVDQRNLPRLVDTALPNAANGGDGTDMGAVELAAPQVTLPPAPPRPSFTVSVGGASIAAGTPLLPASLTPFTCTVTIVTMTGCDVAVRAPAAIKVSKKTTVPAGALLAEAQPSSGAGVATLSGKARLTADGRAVLKRVPAGVDAIARGVAEVGGGNALTTAGKVHLLAGPSVTFKLKKGTKLPTTVKAQLRALGRVLTGAKTISVTATGPSKKKAAKLAKAGATSLRDGGIKVTPKTAGKKRAKRRLKVTFTL